MGTMYNEFNEAFESKTDSFIANYGESLRTFVNIYSFLMLLNFMFEFHSFTYFLYYKEFLNFFKNK